MTTGLEVIEQYLNDIIDELHPQFVATSDETMVEDFEDHGVFERSFKHENGKNYLMRWSVYYGSPETVKTIFEPAKEILV